MNLTFCCCWFSSFQMGLQKSSRQMRARKPVHEGLTERGLDLPLYFFSIKVSFFMFAVETQDILLHLRYIIQLAGANKQYQPKQRDEDRNNMLIGWLGCKEDNEQKVFRILCGILKQYVFDHGTAPKTYSRENNQTSRQKNITICK